MNSLISFLCCCLLKKTLVITTNLTNPEPASDRPHISSDVKLPHKRHYLFTLSRTVGEKPTGTQMDHSAIANAVAASFRKAKVLLDYFPAQK